MEETKPSEPSRQMGRFGDSASRQAVTPVNVEQASKRPMWTPTLHRKREGRSRWGRRETVGIGRPESDQSPAGHRGNDDQKQSSTLRHEARERRIISKM